MQSDSRGLSGNSTEPAPFPHDEHLRNHWQAGNKYLTSGEIEHLPECEIGKNFGMRPRPFEPAPSLTPRFSPLRRKGEEDGI
jgi:hypothetical protein